MMNEKTKTELKFTENMPANVVDLLTRPGIMKIEEDVRAARIKKNFHQRLFDAVMEDKVFLEDYIPDNVKSGDDVERRG